MVHSDHLGRDDLVRRVIALAMPVAVPVACAYPRCPNVAVWRGRCPEHRQTTTQRGYGAPHQQAREALQGLLPIRCGYCARMVWPDQPWVAAHRIDGNPFAGWMVSHPICNERAKLR